VKNKKSLFSKNGFGLVELMLAVAMIAGITIGILAMLQSSIVASVKAREQMSAGRLAQLIFSKLKAVDFYYLFNYDSDLLNYGLSGTYGPATSQSATYPYLTVLNNIKTIIKTAGFDRFTVEVTFMRRDYSDANTNGLTSDLINFIDENPVNKIDDYLSSVRYYDSNSDLDYYDTYISSITSKKIAEEPDTHMKYVTLKLYKKEETIHQESQLISFELYTGMESQASDAALKLFVTQPENATTLYDLTYLARLNAFNLTITKTYPTTVIAYRADTVNPIRLWGETDPQSSVHFYLNAPITELDNTTADISGEFDFQSSGVTNALSEGENTIYAMATRDAMYSPYSTRDVLLDISPPTISSPTPSGTIADLTPWVGCLITDTVITTGTASGICSDIICMKINSVEVEHQYNSETGEVIWIDSTTSTYPQLTNGTYNVTIEAGDNAYYKVMSSWTFTVSVSDPDNSAPAIAEKSPIGTCSESMPEMKCKVSDNQSGINPGSIIFRVDGVIVSHTYNPGTKFVSWTPSTPLINFVSHTVEISVSHWATSPADKVTSTESWSFNLSY